MASNKPIPANDGKNGVYIYRGIVDVNQVHLRWGDWIGGNPKDSNEVLTKCISKMNTWRTNGDNPDIMIIAMHPSWTNSWICWGATSSDKFHDKFKTINPSGSFTTTPIYGNVQVFTLQQIDNSEFRATPLDVAIGNNSFNINTFPASEYYKNGTYTFSASSTEQGLNGIFGMSMQPYYPFMVRRGSGGWASNGSGPTFSRIVPQYNISLANGYSQEPYDASGKYVGGGGCGNTWTTIDDGKQSFSGEWIQVQLPYSLLLNRYSLMTNAKKFNIFGSNDGKEWKYIDGKSDVGVLDDPRKEYVVYGWNAYSYFRLVIREIYTANGNETLKNVRSAGVYMFALIGKQGDVGRERFQSSIGNEGFAVYEGLTDIYAQETTLLKDLADFNQKYSDYTDCSFSKCATLSQKRAAMTQAYNTIIQTDIPNVNNAMPSGGLTPAQYDASFANLVTTHDSVVKLRNELDIKMKELNRDSDSKYADYKNNFDSAIYTNILVTVLATTFIYFTFTKL
jgi:hypothetical protein